MAVIAVAIIFVAVVAVPMIGLIAVFNLFNFIGKVRCCFGFTFLVSVVTAGVRVYTSGLYVLLI